MSCEDAAMVFNELPGLYKAPSNLQPSISQWEALITSCCGAMATSNFGLVAEHFMSLNDDTYLTQSFIHELTSSTGTSNGKRRLAGEPKDIAAVIHAIGRLSLGSLIAIELHGSAICGFLAAMANWFFGLEVQIRKGGIIVHSTVSDPQAAQIIVEYKTESCPAQSQNLRLASKSYQVFNVASILDPKYGQDLPCLGGRISWEKALRTTFGVC